MDGGHRLHDVAVRRLRVEAVLLLVSWVLAFSLRFSVSSDPHPTPRQRGSRAGGAHSPVRIMAPSGPMATVCSKWADSFPSAVTIVQRSSLYLMSLRPALIIGSMANVIPHCKRSLRPGIP